MNAHWKRQTLVHVAPDVLKQAARQASDAHQQAGWTHWAEHDLPLVVTQQPATLPTGTVHLGVPLPTQWGRLRMRLTTRVGDVVGTAEFPPLSALLRYAPLNAAPALATLGEHLLADGLTPRVYGSHGWQHLTGLNYLRQQSDLDLLVPVPDVGAADLAAQRLNTCAPDDGRLDGELVFPDGSAVAWREWHAWRAGCTRQCLVKQHQGATLVSDVGWLTCGTA